MTRTIILLVLCAIIILAVIFYTNKDNFQYYYDPLLTSPTPQHGNVNDFFKEVDSDTENSIDQARYKRACNACVTSNEMLRPITPRNCELCKSYVKGHMLKFRSMGIL